MKEFLKRSALWLALISVILTYAGCSPKTNDGHEESSSATESERDSEQGTLGDYVVNIPDKKSAIESAKQQNSDSIAWVEVPNTTINEVVVQTTNNDFYVRRNALKQDAFEGCYYADYECKFAANGAPTDKNTIIYGHNLGNPQGRADDPNHVKFAQLFKFLDLDMAKKTPYFYFSTEAGTYMVEIFAVYYCEAVTKPVPYHYPNYSPEDFKALVDDAKARSELIYDVNVAAGDRIVTLSTCSYKYGVYSQNPNQRFVVMGRIVQAGETIKEKASVKKNPNPKAPMF